ncbi:MAG: P1 family peptidase, partial [Anaerotignum sp.]|nr:P1 family peptidase [Anaerotignum sp.]
RGAAPGTRETDLLDPVNAMEKVQAVVLSGGSAFGLEAASGVMDWLEEKNIGFDVGFTKVPIVPAAVLFDLGYGDTFTRPDKAMGRQACENASDSVLMEGDYGAGCGATVGKLRGMDFCSNSGIGSWCEATENGIKVAALIAVNAFGDVYENGTIIAGTKDNSGNFISTEEGVLQMASSLSFSGQNTTIGIIATNVKLTKAQAKKVAGMAHDGLARCIRPIHTTMDGDTLFCLSTEEIELPAAPVDVVGILAAKATEQAVIRAVKAVK